MKKHKRTCFVIMPFSPTKSCKDWTSIFENLISPAIKGVGLSYSCERSNIEGGPFIKGILENLYKADLVIADITDKNPNVFYELGVRHTLRNKTIIITQDLNHLPSDLDGYGVVLYQPTLEGLAQFKSDLKRIVKKIHENPDRSDNPVSDYIKNRNYLIFDYERDNILRRLSSLHSELFDNLTTIIKNKQNYNDIEYPIYGSFSICIQDLLTTQYVDVSLEVHAILKECVLHFQKIDYYAKLLSGQAMNLREAHRDVFSFHMDAAITCIWRVKEEVQKMITDISDNNIRIEKKEPNRRSVFWESSQEAIENWLNELAKKNPRKPTEENT